MENIFNNIQRTLDHLHSLHAVFSNEQAFLENERLDFENYRDNLIQFSENINNEFVEELYKQQGRQMILADFIEYLFLGRMYLKLRTSRDKELFIKAILHYVNLLMTYETLTVSNNLRRNFLNELENNIEDVNHEDLFEELRNFVGKVGLTEENSDASRQLNRYFDTLLPKTAGGLWHELLVFIFIMRSDFGYIIPLLLSQRLIGKDDHIVPPDYLIIGHDKRIYGVEVGTKKEIQSGSFSIRTGIPTATIDTINSRNSDRCPICNKWILFCPYVIENYSNFNYEINNSEIRCSRDCNLFTQVQIINGECKYTKYFRNRRTTLEYTHHIYANNRHYHYQCVLNNVTDNMKDRIIESNDSLALKAHYPYYSGLNELKKP